MFAILVGQAGVVGFIGGPAVIFAVFSESVRFFEYSLHFVSQSVNLSVDVVRSVDFSRQVGSLFVEPHSQFLLLLLVSFRFSLHEVGVHLFGKFVHVLCRSLAFMFLCSHCQEVGAGESVVEIL